MSNLGARIRYYRKKRNLKLRNVSSETGLSVSFLSDIERDKATPSLATCQTLADHYNITLTLLFAGVRIEEQTP